MFLNKFCDSLVKMNVDGLVTHILGRSLLPSGLLECGGKWMELQALGCLKQQVARARAAVSPDGMPHKILKRRCQKGKQLFLFL